MLLFAGMCKEKKKKIEGSSAVSRGFLLKDRKNRLFV